MAGDSASTRNPGRALTAVAAVGLVLLGAGGWLVGSAAEARGPRLAAPAAPVNTGARDPMDIRAHNSPSLARHPTDADNLVVTSRVDSPAFACAVYVTVDGGRNWTESPLPPPAGEEPKCFAPDAAFGADGTLHVSFVTLAGNGNVPHAGWTTSSGDGGRTFATPVRALGPLSFQVRLAADLRRAGRIWLTWLEASDVGLLAFSEPGNPVKVARSDDGGATWGPPVQVSRPERRRVVAPSPAVARSGRLHVAYLDVGEDSLDYHGGHQGRGGDPYPGQWQLVVATSGDGGTTWSESVAEPGLVPTERFVAFLPPSPSLAADPGSDRLYAAFTSGTDGDADVWLWTSPDAGATWSAGERVNDTPAGDGRSQYLPRLDTAPGGRLDVVYYDRREDPADVMNKVSLQSSSDGGASFGPRVELSGAAFDSRIGFGSERDLPDLGSRLAVDSTDAGVTAVWSDTRGGTQASGKQDLALARVEVADGGGWARLRTPIRVAAVVATAAGLLLLARAVWR